MITKLLYSLGILMSDADPATARPDFPKDIAKRASAYNSERIGKRIALIVDFQASQLGPPNQSLSQSQLPFAQNFVATKPHVQMPSVQLRQRFSADQALSEPVARESGAALEIGELLRSDFANAPNTARAVSSTQTVSLTHGSDCTTTAHKPASFLSSKAQRRRRILYPLMQQAACRHRIPVDLFDALISQESQYDAFAHSPVGAFGLAQLMPGTARELGADRYSVLSNLEGGARYLKAQLNRFASAPLALAAYNAGPARVTSRWAVPNIRETRNYVASVIAKWQQLSRHQSTQSVFAKRLEHTASAPVTDQLGRRGSESAFQIHRSAAVLQF